MEQLNEILKRPGIAASNPDLAGLGAGERKQGPVTALVKDAPAESDDRTRVVVRIVTFRRRLLDSDNHTAGGTKHLRDLIARSLGVDDADKRVEWEYAQVKTDGPQGTLVAVHQLQDLPSKKL